jgi:hypothetical protein
MKVPKEERRVVYKDENFLIIHPLTHRASCKYGAFTKWCTSTPSNPGPFNNYSAKGLLLYFLYKKSYFFGLYKKTLKYALYKSKPHYSYATGDYMYIDYRNDSITKDRWYNKKDENIPRPKIIKTNISTIIEEKYISVITTLRSGYYEIAYNYHEKDFYHRQAFDSRRIRNDDSFFDVTLLRIMGRKVDISVDFCAYLLYPSNDIIYGNNGFFHGVYKSSEKVFLRKKDGKVEVIRLECTPRLSSMGYINGATDVDFCKEVLYLIHKKDE